MVTGWRKLINYEKNFNNYDFVLYTLHINYFLFNLSFCDKKLMTNH